MDAALRLLVEDGSAVDAYDDEGKTALMIAAESPAAGAPFLRLLLEHGASPKAVAHDKTQLSVLAYALRGGDPDKARVLLEAGADLHYLRTGGYDALTDAVHGHESAMPSRLLELLDLIIAQAERSPRRSPWVDFSLTTRIKA